jgi:hypothetical protein
MSTEGLGTMLFALLGGIADPVGTGRDGCAADGRARAAASAC